MCPFNLEVACAKFYAKEIIWTGIACLPKSELDHSTKTENTGSTEPLTIYRISNLVWLS